MVRKACASVGVNGGGEAGRGPVVARAPSRARSCSGGSRRTRAGRARRCPPRRPWAGTGAGERRASPHCRRTTGRQCRPRGRGQTEPAPRGLGARPVRCHRPLGAPDPPSLHGGVRLRGCGAGSDPPAAARSPARPLARGATAPGRAGSHSRLLRPAAPRPRGAGHHGDDADQAPALADV